MDVQWFLVMFNDVSRVFPARPEADWAKESNKTKVCDCGLFCQSRMIPARLKQLHFDEYLETNFLKISNDIKWYQYWIFVEKKGLWMLETVWLWYSHIKYVCHMWIYWNARCLTLQSHWYLCWLLLTRHWPTEPWSIAHGIPNSFRAEATSSKSSKFRWKETHMETAPPSVSDRRTAQTRWPTKQEDQHNVLLQTIQERFSFVIVLAFHFKILQMSFLFVDQNVHPPWLTSTNAIRCALACPSSRRSSCSFCT